MDQKQYVYWFVSYCGGSCFGNYTHIQDAATPDFNAAECMQVLERTLGTVVTLISWAELSKENYERIADYFTDLMHRQNVKSKTHLQSVPPQPVPIRPQGDDSA